MKDLQSNTRYDNHIKTQLVAASGMSLAAAAVILAVGAPLPRSLAWLGLVSTFLYGGYYFLFDRLAARNYLLCNSVMGILGAAILTAAVHMTGGIASPFVFMYFTIILSESIYGLGETYSLVAILGGYLGVVAGQYSGFLHTDNPWAAQIYASLPATGLIAGITVMYLFISRRLSAVIVDKLHVKLSREVEDKDALLRKFSELNATAQLGVLAHRIAHDLRGPIASVSGFLEMEMARVKDPEELETLRGVNESVEGMVQALHGITRFGKPGGASREAIHLRDFVRDLLSIAAFAPQAKGVEFEVREPDGGGLAVNASRSDLQQAFFNILKNAVEAVAGNAGARKITISLSRSGPSAVIAMTDNGPGIGEAALKEIFRRSFTTKKDGTGVGLLITRDLLLRNGGDIKLRNADGGGLSAEVKLPAQGGA